MAQKQVENLDPIDISEQQFDLAVCYIGSLKTGLIEFLKQPKHINIFNLLGFNSPLLVAI